MRQKQHSQKKGILFQSILGRLLTLFWLFYIKTLGATHLHPNACVSGSQQVGEINLSGWRIYSSKPRPAGELYRTASRMYLRPPSWWQPEGKLLYFDTPTLLEVTLLKKGLDKTDEKLMHKLTEMCTMKSIQRHIFYEVYIDIKVQKQTQGLI